MTTAIQSMKNAEREMAEAGPLKGRSEFVFRARVQLPNRYQLCRLAALAARKLHKPSDRIQDTTNDVLLRLGIRASESTSTSPVVNSIPVLRAASSETQSENFTWMPINQAVPTSEGRGV